MGTKEEESHLFELLSKQIENLQHQQNKFTKESQECLCFFPLNVLKDREKNMKLREEIHHLETENFVLEQKMSREVKRREALKREIMENEMEKERFKELHFNMTKHSPRNVIPSPRNQRGASPLGFQVKQTSPLPVKPISPIPMKVSPHGSTEKLSPRIKKWKENQETE
jgi:hypothetical protein